MNKKPTIIRRADDLLSNFFWTLDVGGGGDCLFYCLSYFVNKGDISEEAARRVRLAICKQTGSEMCKDGEWGRHEEVIEAARLYKNPIIVLSNKTREKLPSLSLKVGAIYNYSLGEYEDQIIEFQKYIYFQNITKYFEGDMAPIRQKLYGVYLPYNDNEAPIEEILNSKQPVLPEPWIFYNFAEMHFQVLLPKSEYTEKNILLNTSENGRRTFGKYKWLILVGIFLGIVLAIFLIYIFSKSSSAPKVLGIPSVTFSAGDVSNESFLPKLLSTSLPIKFGPANFADNLLNMCFDVGAPYFEEKYDIILQLPGNIPEEGLFLKEIAVIDYCVVLVNDQRVYSIPEEIADIQNTLENSLTLVYLNGTSAPANNKNLTAAQTISLNLSLTNLKDTGNTITFRLGIIGAGNIYFSIG